MKWCIKQMLGLLKVVYFIITHGFKKNQIQYKKNNKNEMVVLGNGPSLKEVLPRLKVKENKDYLCVNSFATTPYFEQLKPKYYVLADHAYWTKPINHNDDLVNQLVDQLSVNRAKLLEALIEKTKWEMELFVPFADKEDVIKKALIKNANIKVRKYNLGYPNGINKQLLFALCKRNYMSLGGQTVLTTGIFIAINSGYSKIYVLGGDHSMHRDLWVRGDNRVVSQQAHFYSNNASISVNPVTGVVFSMGLWLTSLGKMFYEHMELEDYSKFRKSKILNSTKDSFIDAYERFDYEKLC